MYVLLLYEGHVSVEVLALWLLAVEGHSAVHCATAQSVSHKLQQ